ncbi:MAG: hypothetical protein ACI9N1_002155 [Flavobacteriales bacterium]|jgi:hypothetical protein
MKSDSSGVFFAILNNENLQLENFSYHNFSDEHLENDTQLYGEYCDFRGITVYRKNGEIQPVSLTYRVKESYEEKGGYRVILEARVMSTSENMNGIKEHFINFLILSINQTGEIINVLRIPRKNFKSGYKELTSCYTIRDNENLYLIHNYDKVPGYDISRSPGSVDILLTTVTIKNEVTSKLLENGEMLIDTTKPIELLDNMYILKTNKRLSSDTYGEKKFSIGRIELK